MPDKKEQLIAALKHLVTVSPQDNTKGRLVDDWFSQHYKATVGISHVTEQKQTGNRASEQLRHEPAFAVFVIDSADFEDSMKNAIRKHASRGLQSVWILKKSPGPAFEGLVHMGEAGGEIEAFFKDTFPGLSHERLHPVVSPTATQHVAPSENSAVANISDALIKAFVSDASNVRLQCDLLFFQRLVAALLAKKLLILTGLAGSGKTKIAQAFARWITPKPANAGDANPHYALIPVGADWTGNENIVGYPNGLVAANYVTKPALELILHAQEHKDIPHFLILDEMNLSHVERYFADLLSAIESGEGLELYPGDTSKPETWKKSSSGTPIPPKLGKLPENLFIIGTVNVDETTYMFSPKVLDRANVIEFRVTETEMSGFLANPQKPDLDKLAGLGEPFAAAFAKAVAQKPESLTGAEKARFDSEMNLFFTLLREHGAEFGYRVAHEAARLLHFYKTLGGFAADDAKWLDAAFDALVMQKFLPKLHGSKVKLGPLLRKIYTASIQPHAVASRDAKTALAKLVDPSRDIPADARYPVTAEKVSRMWRQLGENGFTSFAEN